MDDYRKELDQVNRELMVIQTEISELLDRQAALQEKKTELETILKENKAKKKVEDAQKDWDKNDFPWCKDLLQKQKSVFKVEKLRPLQLQTMNVTMAGNDCMLIMPTGGGKSLCFQLPALISPGITLVVSPLVSLMEDQVMALVSLGVEAAMLNASCTPAMVKQTQEAMIDRNSPLKLLYVTPEKLAKSKRFMAKLEKMYTLGRFSRLVIDEVHCCSQWGHDFRPDYKFLGIMKRQFPEVPILGLTATATLSVLTDVKKILNIPNDSCYLFKASFNRPNLYYEVRQKADSQEKTMDDIQSFITKKFKGGSGIVYCFSKREAEEVTMDLQRRGIHSGCYHGDCSAQERSRVHRDWMANKIQVVVATVAFGMGIDKPDVRFVIHHSISKSMENLYQESGRAGRDELRSHCLVYYRLADVFRQSSMVFTEQTGLEKLMGIVAYCIDMTRCRRSMIARHFGEMWDSSHCNHMCDHCDPLKHVETERSNMTQLCRDVITILDHAADLTQRLTAIKLIDAWLGKGNKLMKGSGASIPTLARDQCELVLANMLQEGYIREDYHFTPYTTISYLVPGSKAGRLRDGSAKVLMTLRSSVARCLSSQHGPKDRVDSQAQSQLAKTKDRPKPGNTKPARPNLVVINRENSMFADHVQSIVPENSKPQKSPSKRKRPIIFEEDDDEELSSLDFCEDVSKSSATARKHGKNKLRNSSKHDKSTAMSSKQSSSKCIILDDSD